MSDKQRMVVKHFMSICHFSSQQVMHAIPLCFNAYPGTSDSKASALAALVAALSAW